MVQLPVGSTLEQTEAVMNEVQELLPDDEKEAVESVHGDRAGSASPAAGQNQGMVFVKLKDWDLRDRPDLRAKAVAGRAMGRSRGIRDAIIFVFPPPAVTELGTATGFDLMLQDRGGLGHEKLTEARNQLLGMAAKDPRLARVRPNGMPDVPAVQGRHRLGEGRRPRRPGQRGPALPLGGLRQRLRRQLRPGRPRQARLRAGRRPLPHAAGATSTAST